MSQVICPACGKVNEFANEEGFAEGPREYHADCWFAKTAQGNEKMTQESLTVQGVVNATIELVQEKLKAKWGSLQDCCTDANQMIYDMLKDGVELKDEFYIPSLERIQGTVNVNGENMPHEWIRIEGTDYDATAEQFGFNGVGNAYNGEVVEW